MSLQDNLTAAVADGHLLQSTAENVGKLLETSQDPMDAASVDELVAAGEWAELNDRFYQQLAFGTGGLRSRTIGKVVTAAERGSAAPDACPEFPAVGSNSMNFRNVGRATRGLADYVREWHEKEGRPGRASIVFAHDTRHFSRAFAEHCARVTAAAGCDAYLFDSHRSTPQLSFAVRHLNASAGVMLTASHNPPHDNGFKAYFADGGQIVEPHASLIIGKVNALEGGDFPEAAETGEIHEIGSDNDADYLAQLQSVLLQPELLQGDTGLKIVFTNLHGVGGVHIPDILRKAGLDVETVAAQDTPDGDFPTVESPNPENAPALQMAIDQAVANGADIVIGTDPDCDRMGVACRNAAGEMQLITGNQIGSMLAWYRTKTFFDLGVLTEKNRERSVIIKTFVTTDLQAAIAKAFGVGCVDTLTGFKYIGAKLEKYERSLPAAVQDGYRSLDPDARRTAHLADGCFFIFGGEESYGYLAADFLRDKDGNMAALMFAELAAYAKSRGLTVPDLLDEIWQTYGYFLEKNYAKVFEGASGAAKIKALAASYADNPPTELDGAKVVSSDDYNSGEFRDAEGDPIPKAAMMIITLEDGRRFAVRPSGTEPKIKYYLFGSKAADNGKLSAEELASAKTEVTENLASLWTAIEADIETRLA